MNGLVKWALLAAALMPCIAVTAQQVAGVWIADQGNGTYRNPVLHADYSDPDVIRVGEDYYLTASSFNCMPGLPILHSKDLVNWRIINHAVNRLEPAEIYDQPQHGKGVWAPAFLYDRGTFFIYYPDPDYGIFRVSAKDPAGQWSAPELVLPGKGIIDPSVFRDDDGSMYLAVAWAGSRAGVNSLLTLFRLNDEGNKVTDEGRHIFDGHGEDHTVEGPKIYKRNGYYYILPPAGGVPGGWQLALRSKHIYGPYERKVVMDQGTTPVNGPHQGALVQTPAGTYWFLHFQDKGAYGRVVHLQPVTWKNDWPVMGTDKDGDGKGEPVATFRKPVMAVQAAVAAPATSDEFNSDTLGLQWQWHANPKITWRALMPGTGYLRLFAVPQNQGAVNLWTAPNLLLQKLPAPAFTATTRITYQTEWDVWQGKKAGLLLMGNDYAYIAIHKRATGYYISQVVCKEALNNSVEEVVAEKPVATGSVYLRVAVTAPDARCHFSFSEDGVHFQDLGAPFICQPDKWIGAKVGLFCTAPENRRIGGYADVDWFRVTL